MSFILMFIRIIVCPRLPLRYFSDLRAKKLPMKCDYRITFADIKEDSYEWVGEWVNKAETIRFSHLEDKL